MQILDKSHLGVIEEPYPWFEEIINTVTHGVGIVLSVIALVLLILRGLSCVPSEILTPSLVGFAIYGVSLILVYTSSTFYHAVPFSAAKQLLCVLDQCAIFLLIAGSYSAFCLSVLYGPLGISLFIVIWTLAFAGILSLIAFRNKIRWITMSLYLFMGWLVLFAAVPVFQSMNWLTVSMVIAGGVAYTVGFVFFSMKYWWAHPVWHLFVLGGSAFQYVAIYFLY